VNTPRPTGPGAASLVDYVAPRDPSLFFRLLRLGIEVMLGGFLGIVAAATVEAFLPPVVATAMYALATLIVIGGFVYGIVLVVGRTVRLH
jgi:hypothetical protein